MAAYRFQRAHVVGDGEQTIESLLSARIASRSRNPLLATREIDRSELELALTMQKLQIGSVPEPGQTIQLTTSAIPTGSGDFVSCVKDVAPEVTNAAVRAARAVTARNCAVDLVVDRLGEPFVLELNLRAMIGFLSFPSNEEQPNLDVPDAILNRILPKGPQSRKLIHRFDFERLKTDILDQSRARRVVCAEDYADWA